MTGHPVLALRPGHPTDAGTLGAMMTAAAAAQPWRPKLYSGAEDIAHAGTMIDRGWITVAEQGQPVGFIARDETEIHAVFVASAFQRTGVARALIADAQRRVGRLSLWTHAENHAARRCYRGCGFVERTPDTPPTNEEGLPEVSLYWAKDDAP